MKKILSILAFLLPFLGIKAQNTTVEIKKDPQGKVLPQDVKENEFKLKDANLPAIKQSTLKGVVDMKYHKDVSGKDYKNVSGKDYKQALKRSK